jgi:branched-chain amino acid transport system substrate-binding protein
LGGGHEPGGPGSARPLGFRIWNLGGGEALRPGAADAEIKIGQTIPYSDAASAYGTIGKAEAAHFAMINDQDGINGRKIKFLILDDGYSPPKTVEQIRKLVEQEQVLLLFQTMGTATNIAVHKYVNDKKVPHLFLASGASLWADPEHFPGRWAGSPTCKPKAQSSPRTS